MTQKELYDKYLQDLASLRQSCKHEKISDWMLECWAPAHTTGRKVKACEICGSVVEAAAFEGFVTSGSMQCK